MSNKLSSATIGADASYLRRLKPHDDQIPPIGAGQLVAVPRLVLPAYQASGV